MESTPPSSQAAVESTPPSTGRGKSGMLPVLLSFGLGPVLIAVAIPFQAFTFATSLWCSAGWTRACERACRGQEPSDCKDEAGRNDCQAAGGACQRYGLSWLKEGGRPAVAAGAFARACELGFESGCGSLGYLTLNGQGRTRDEQRAFELFGRGCRGEPLACLEQGILVHLGRGTRMDRELSRRLFSLGCGGTKELAGRCAEGNLEACAVEPLLLGIGACGAADLGRAQQLAKLACSRGFDWHCQRLAEIAGD